MKLYYHEGKNFGDAINPILMEGLLPGFFDGDDAEIVVGIGSILGWLKVPDGCRKVIIFSSGFADNQASTYGAPPQLDERFDVICVRGKLTAERIGVPLSCGISDGALLLPLVLKRQKTDAGVVSFMPHHGTLNMYPGWKKLAVQCGMVLIDPRDEPLQVLDQICASKLVLAEAMHGAITADAYRVPWIAVCTTPLINSFKWRDYLETVNLTYQPSFLPTLLSPQLIRDAVKRRLGKAAFKPIVYAVAAPLIVYQALVKIPLARRKLRRISRLSPILCAEGILRQRQNQLMECVDLIKTRYQHNRQ